MEFSLPTEFSYELLDNETIANVAFPERVYKIKDSDTSNEDFDEQFFNVLDINYKQRKIHFGDIINMCEKFPEFCI